MKNKKLVYTIIGIVSIALIALAITYAYWQITKTQQGVNEISSACLDISLVDAESGNTGVTLQEQYPLSDTEGATLKPYKFTVTNNCDTAVDYQIALESIGDSTTVLKASSLKVMLDDKKSLLNANETVTPTVSGAYTSHKLGMGTLEKSRDAGSSVTHELRLWIDETAPVEENNKTYNGKITVTIGQGISAATFEKGSLAYTLINAYGGEAAITELDSSAFATATTADDAGMYKAMDDYGTSYYYRGNVTNNYVKFGSYAANSTVNEVTYDVETPIYWRIVRINGDGTVRLIYSGISKVANGESAESVNGNQYYNSRFNRIVVGYMYGTDEDPYGDNQETTLTDSEIKGAIDLWYEANLKASYESYIADRIFCNDREVYSASIENNGTFEYEYVTYKSANRITKDLPALICANQRDRFTADDTTLGNGHLANPVGLITADEVVMAGYSFNGMTSSNYLYTGNTFWTSSPDHYDDSDGAYMFLVDGNALVSDYTDWGAGSDARPVINLKADVEFTIDEDGTYVITTN